MTLRRRGPTLVVVAVVVLAVAVTASLALRRGHPAVAAASTTAPAARGTVTVTASAAGTVTVAQTRGLSFTTSAVVTELDVKVGDQVTAGQVLARIDSTDAQGAVNAAQQQVANAQTGLTKALAPAPTCAAVAPAALLWTPAPSPSASPSAGPSPSANPSGHPSPSHSASA